MAQSRKDSRREKNRTEERIKPEISARMKKTKILIQGN